MGSYILSAGGDRLALVALTLLVYGRTRSPLLAAVTFAAGYVPYLAGALPLSGIADRRPRREVMVGCDVARMIMVAAMLIPRMPLAALIASLDLVRVHVSGIVIRFRIRTAPARQPATISPGEVSGASRRGWLGGQQPTRGRIDGVLAGHCV